MKKKLLALVLAAAMTLSLASCGGSKTETPSTGSDNSSASSDNSSAEGATYKVGICQLVQHPALDAATQGFIDALNEALPGQVEFENKNASGEANNCGTIVNGFVSDGRGPDHGQRHRRPDRPPLPRLPTFPFWAPPSPLTAWPWILTISTAP